MKIASFNINNVRKRLPNLIAWLRSAKPDVACLQELKATDREFPADALRKAGYEAVWRGEKTWNGVAILARGVMPVVTRTELPGDPDDKQGRYIEAAVNGVLIASLYAPNGNPQPGPKFDYKLAWFKRLTRHAASLNKAGIPVVLAGDYNVVPTAQDIYQTTSYDDDALLQPQSRAAYQRLLAQGWVDAVRALHPDAPMYTFWDYMRKRWERDAGLRLDQILLTADLRAAPARGRGRSRHARQAERQRSCAGVDCVARRRGAVGEGARHGGNEGACQACRQSRARQARRRQEQRAAAAAGDRRRFVRAPRLSRAAEDHHARGQQAGRRDPRLRQLPAADSIRANSRAPCWWAGTRSKRRPIGTKPSPPIRAAANSTTPSSSSSTCCPSSSRLAASSTPRRPATRPTTSSPPPRPREERTRRHRAGRERRPRHLPAGVGRTTILYPGARRRGRAHRAGRGARRATASTLRRCRISSRCAAIPPTGCRARAMSGRKAPPTCCAGTARSKARSRPAGLRRRPRSCGSIARSPPWTARRRCRGCPTRRRPGQRRRRSPRKWQLNQLAERLAKLA